MSKSAVQHGAESIRYRIAEADDLDILVDIENRSFSADKLSRRSLRHWIKASHGILLLVEVDGIAAGYGLVWCHRGTRLARLYSLAVLPECRGRGLAASLIANLELLAAQRGRLFMRLEVASVNSAAISVYERAGYRVFGEYADYYDDHSTALRMQKTIQRLEGEGSRRQTPWYAQTTDFTCGPAALMMAMASLDARLAPSQPLELDLWREATSIFMTSGHGGCHPLGLALAAAQRGFVVEVTLNTRDALFVEGVRSAEKKSVLEVVHSQFVARCRKEPRVHLHYIDVEQRQIIDWLQQGYAVVVLISTYRLDGKKSPHWVTLTGYDEHCFYLHDPDLNEHDQLAIDCQHVPIARDDFAHMSVFGANRLRTAVALKKISKKEQQP